MTEACYMRFQKLQELNEPLSDEDGESVIMSLSSLVECIVSDILMDLNSFKDAFSMEIDLVEINVGLYLDQLVLYIESRAGILSSVDILGSGSRSVFELYRKLRALKDKLRKYVAG
jgi:hypothetical protein